LGLRAKSPKSKRGYILNSRGKVTPEGTPHIWTQGAKVCNLMGDSLLASYLG